MTPTQTPGSHVVTDQDPSKLSPGRGAPVDTDMGDGGMPFAWRVWILAPLLLLVLSVILVVNNGDRLIEALGHNPPTADEFLVSRVDFVPGEIRVKVTNPQHDALTVATVTVDDAIIPYELEGGPNKIGRLDQRTIHIPFTWVEDDPYLIGITSSSGIQTTHEVPVAVERLGPNMQGVLAGGLLGLLVGVLPVALGLAWLPSLRRTRREWLAAFMAMTAGLLAFVALDAFAGALEVQVRLPSAISGTGTILLGITFSYLSMSFMQHRAGRKRHDSSSNLSPFGLAMLVAVGIGLHNLGEGLAIGSSFALGELSLGIFLIVGFMIHNITEGLGIAVPASGSEQVRLRDAFALTMVAGAPAIFGIWIGRYVTNDLIGVLFFSLAVGAALHVIVEVSRQVRRLTPGGGLFSGWSAGGFLAGIVVMYVTGVMVG